MNLKFETLCRLLFDFVNDIENYPYNHKDNMLCYKVVFDITNKIDDNELFHIFVEKV